MKSSESDLQDLREEIGETTMEIFRLVVKRNDLAKRIGKVKRRDSLPVEDEGVEDALLNQVIQVSVEAGLDRQVATKILSILVSESKKIQGKELQQHHAGRRPDDQTTQTMTPMAIFGKAMQLQREGKRLIRLDVGEPDFPPPKAVLDATSEALYSFKTRYTATRGIPPLVEALTRHIERKRSYKAAENQIMVTPGGRFAVYAALATTVREGESAIVIEPNWPAYREGIEYIGARPIRVRTALEDGWEPTPEALKRAIRPNTTALVLSYPANPTGKLIGKRAFKELVGIAEDSGLVIISDEIYNEYAYTECPSILEVLPERFILTSSFSKTWSMTGFRAGYALSDPATIGRMLQISSLMITSVPEFIQYGAIKALEASDAEVSRNSAQMKQRIDAVSHELDDIEELEYYGPDGAMYFFPQARDKNFDAAEFAARLLNEKGVTIAPGIGFGDYPRCFRISLGQPLETIVSGVRKIGETLD